MRPGFFLLCVVAWLSVQGTRAVWYTTLSLPFPKREVLVKDMALPPDRPLQEGQPTSAHEKRERRRRKDAGHPRWEDRDYYVLKWIGTQGVIRFDQLRQLLGRESEDLDD